MKEPRQIVTDLALCLLFFTRLPLPPVDLGSRTLSQSIWAAPIIGVLVALAGAIVYAIAALCGLSAGSAAALALAVAMLITGCLHEDGLSDTADGFGGGRTREKKLEIMRDSRIGTYGACALALSILLRWSALADLGSPLNVACGLVAAHAGSRALLPALMHLLPSARPDGLSASAGLVTANTAVTALLIGAVGLLTLGLAGIVTAVLCLAVLFALFSRLCRVQIGGQTGDTVGALQQAGEITILLVASAIFY